MKRIIKDYKNISQEHADLIAQHFPNGFENDNLISFTTPKGKAKFESQEATSEPIIKPPPSQEATTQPQPAPKQIGAFTQKKI